MSEWEHSHWPWFLDIQSLKMLCNADSRHINGQYLNFMVNHHHHHKLDYNLITWESSSSNSRHCQITILYPDVNITCLEKLKMDGWKFVLKGSTSHQIKFNRESFWLFSRQSMGQWSCQANWRGGNIIDSEQPHVPSVFQLFFLLFFQTFIVAFLNFYHSPAGVPLIPWKM